jgi:hypothetical protein
MQPLTSSYMNKEKHFHHQFFAIAPDVLDDPFGVISDICENDSLFGTRKQIFELFSAAMGCEDWRTDDPLDKANRMYRLKLMIQMVEVVYFLDHLQETDQLLKYVQTSK